MKKKLLSVLMAAVMVAGVGGVGAAQVKADDEKILGAGIYSASDNFNSYIGKAITNACESLKQTSKMDRMTSPHRTIRLIQCWLKALLQLQFLYVM